MADLRLVFWCVYLGVLCCPRTSITTSFLIAIMSGLGLLAACLLWFHNYSPTYGARQGPDNLKQPSRPSIFVWSRSLLVNLQTTLTRIPDLKVTSHSEVSDFEKPQSPYERSRATRQAGRS